MGPRIEASDPPNSAQGLLERGLALGRAGQLDDAERVLLEGERRFPVVLRLPGSARDDVDKIRKQLGPETILEWAGRAPRCCGCAWENGRRTKER